MRKSTLAVLTTIFAASLWVPALAQDPANVSLTHTDYVDVKQRVLPTNPQNPPFFYYGVEVLTKYRPDVVAEKLQIDGQRKTENFTDDDYVLHLRCDRIGFPSIAGLAHVYKAEYTSDWMVKVTSSVSGVKLWLTHGTETLVAPYNPMISALSLGGQEYIYVKNFGDYEDKARAYALKRNEDNVKDDVYGEIIGILSNNLRAYASEKVGFFLNEEKIEMKSVATKKHSEYAAMKEKVEGLKSVLATLDGTRPLAEEALREYIGYFKELPERFTTASKADMKIRYCAYHNLVESYLLLDDPAQTIVWAEKLTANGIEPKEGVRRKAQAEKLLETFSTAFFKNRQFDTTSYLDQLPPRL